MFSKVATALRLDIRWVVSLLILLLAHGAIADGKASPNLGTRLTAAEASQHSSVVMPDGTGLPVAAGDAEQGEKIYQHLCLACHGTTQQPGINDKLVGGAGSLDSPHPVRTVGSYWPYATSVFDYVRRAMPYTAPGSLTAKEVYALTAYLLFLNKIVAKDTLLNQRTLPRVVMPNREGFVWSAEVQGAP